MPLLYKYLDPDGIAALRTMTLFASDPTAFNDPFEVRPGFDQERHDYFAKTCEAFHGILGVKHSLLGSRSMVGIPTENAIGFGEQINERFRNELSERYRVLCLSRDFSSALMWGHYTRQRGGLAHTGFVLGLDPSTPGFPTGIKPGGFQVEYPQNRRRVTLPLAYYQDPCVESYDLLNRRIMNSPNQQVQSGGGLFIPFSEYRRQVDAASLAILTTKDMDWAYEQETRFVYELPDHASQLRCEKNRQLVPVPAGALREVIIGFRATPKLAEEVVQLCQEGRLGEPMLFYSGCHPYQYQVQKHEADPAYLLSHYRHMRSTP